MTMRRFFSTPRRCGRRTWTTPPTPPTPTPTATTTMKNTWCLSRACVDARVGSGVCIYYSTSSKDVRSSSSRNVFDVDDEDKEYAEREKKFTLRRKLFRESLKVKNLERANGFTRKNLDASATALGMSPSVVDAMMDGEETVPPELKLLEQCVEDMDEKVKRDLMSSTTKKRKR